MSSAILGYGTVFQTGDGNSPEVFTTFAEVQSITSPKASVDKIDTSHEQPPAANRESFPGFLDFGDVQIVFNFIPGNSSTAALLAEAVNRPTRNRKIIFPDGKIWRFAAYLTTFESSETSSDALNGTATFKVTGNATLT